MFQHIHLSGHSPHTTILGFSLQCQLIYPAAGEAQFRKHITQITPYSHHSVCRYDRPIAKNPRTSSRITMQIIPYINHFLPIITTIRDHVKNKAGYSLNYNCKFPEIRLTSPVNIHPYLIFPVLIKSNRRFVRILIRNRVTDIRSDSPLITQIYPRRRILKIQRFSL